MSNKKIIILLSQGRSGTNGLYRFLFSNSKKKKIEPYKNSSTKGYKRFKQSLIKNETEYRDKTIVHIKPKDTYSNGTYKKLTAEQLVDACLECGINNFIIIKRNNLLAKAVSAKQCFLNLSMEEKIKHKVNLNLDKLKERLHKGHQYEDAVIKHIKSKNDSSIKLVELIYEDDIKNDIKIACEKVVSEFDWLPRDYITYNEGLVAQTHLSSFDRNNNLFDKRPTYSRILNLQSTIKLLQKYNALWMLEKETEK